MIGALLCSFGIHRSCHIPGPVGIGRAYYYCKRCKRFRSSVYALDYESLTDWYEVGDLAHPMPPSYVLDKIYPDSGNF